MMYEKKGRYIVEFQDIPKARQHQIEIDLEERRGSYKEVELGFDEERALNEAKRCLSCRRCLGCALCWAECKPEAIDFEMEDEVFELEVDNVIVAPGVDHDMEKIDRRFGFGTNLNVITDLQLERMLSDTGPSAGLVIRPLDGEIPRSIAWVQSYESALPQMHRAALCLAVNEARLVRRKIDQAEIRIVASDIETFVQDHDADLRDAEKLQMQEGVVESVESLEDGGMKLTIAGSGTKEEKNFDLVVLVTQPRISRDAQSLGKNLGVTLAYAAFLSGEDGGLLATDKEAIQISPIS